MKRLKVKALLNGMGQDTSWEIKDKEAEKIIKLYDSMREGSYMNKRSGPNRLYNGCLLELSSDRNIHVFDGYAIHNENNIIEIRVDKNNKLEKQLLNLLQTAPMLKNLIFNCELSRNLDVQKAV
jgi:hypothetical protein